MTWRKWLPMLAGLVLLFSCRDDDDSSTGGVFRFHVPDGFIENADQYWIILSDESGQVLDWKPLQNANTYTYTLPSDASGAVTITTVHAQAVAGATGFTTDNLIASYTNVPAGTYKFDQFIEAGAGEAEAPSYLVLPNFEANDARLEWIYPQGILTDTSAVEEPAPALKLELTPWAQKTALLAVIREQPDYYLYTVLESGKTYERGEADFKEFTRQAIALPEGTTLSYMQVTGNNAYGIFPYYVNASGEQQEVPTAPGVFDSYTLQASLSDPANELSFSIRLTGELPETLPIMESSLLHFTAEDDVLGWETTTDGLDAVNITVAKYEANYSLYWSVVGEGGEQNIALPRIPDEIPLTGVPVSVNARSFAALAKEYGVNFSLLNFPHYTDYQDYLRKHFLYRTDYAPEDFLESTQVVFPQ